MTTKLPSILSKLAEVKFDAWALALNAAVSLVCAFGAVHVADKHTAEREKAHDQAASRIGDVTEYTRVTTRFDNAAQLYAGLLLSSGKVDEAARSELLATVVDQQRTLGRVQNSLPAAQRPTVTAYENALQGLSENVNDVTGIADMAPYWQSLNNVLVLRRDLDADFAKQRQANG